MKSASTNLFLSTFPLRGTSSRIIPTIEPSIFLSTFPLRGTSRRERRQQHRARDFYPRSPCGERPGVQRHLPRQGNISIHVPLAGNVPRRPPVMSRLARFLSTFPLRGTSWRICQISDFSLLFLSTFPLRGTSRGNNGFGSTGRYFYPRSPCGERPLSYSKSNATG